MFVVLFFVYVDVISYRENSRLKALRKQNLLCSG